MADYLPDGMKIIIFSPDGILENVIRLIGYENLCYLLYDEPDVVSDVFEQVGSRIYRYYKTAFKAYALGTGNSVPTYVPEENYLAMTAAALL